MSGVRQTLPRFCRIREVYPLFRPHRTPLVGLGTVTDCEVGSVAARNAIGPGTLDAENSRRAKEGRQVCW